MKIGIFGGSFSPPHRGHYEIIRQIITKKIVDKLILLPTYQNPLKKNQQKVPIEIRLKMLQIICNKFDDVEISDYEIKQKKVTYTYNSLKFFRKKYPLEHLYFFAGEDILQNIKQWKNQKLLFELSTFIIFNRQNIEPIIIPREFKDKIIKIKLILPEISSTKICNSPLQSVILNNWLHPETIPVWETFISKT